MRAWPAPLIAECGSESTRLAQALYIKRADGLALALTTADIVGVVADVPIGGSVEPSVTFAPSPAGVTFSAWSRSMGTDVDNAEAAILEGGDLTLTGVLDRRWHAAAWVSGVYCWAHPEYGFGPVSCGIVGKIKPQVGQFVLELRDLRQFLGANPTPSTQRGCLWALGSNSVRDGFCQFDTTPVTFAGVAVTAVASASEFTASSLSAQPTDAFGNGLLTWTLGDNAGRQVRITSSAAGVFALDEDMVIPIVVGDQFTAVWGCRGRFDEDCVGKFSPLSPGQYLRFGGFPHLPGPDAALNPPGQDA